MTALRATVLTLRFGCELAMLAALAFWGFAAHDGVVRFVLGLGLPTIAIVVWGAFVAPKAKRPVSTPIRVLIELVLFGAATVALFATDHPVLAITIAVAATITSVLNTTTPISDHERRGDVQTS